MDEFTFKLSHPITDEEWNLITDAELEHTDNIEFTTPSGKKVLFQKVKRGKWIYKSKILAPFNTIWWHECSSCGHHAFNDMTTDYCPHCGAMMDGDPDA